MDKYFKIQKLVELQKERKEKVEEILLATLGFLPKFEIDFRLENKVNYENIAIKNVNVPFVVKVKIKDKSSIKFVVNQNKQKILEGYSKIFVKDKLLIN
jgi:hypothetical protein